MLMLKRTSWTGHVTRIRKKRNAWKVLVAEPEDRPRWNDNIKVDFR
jgi:hypothetical protein